jgi:hypothetical protein
MKRRASATAAAPTSDALFAKAVSRRRERCGVLTAYDHENLAAYLRALLPGFVVHAPLPGTAGISSYPPASADPAVHAEELAHLAAYLGGIPVAEAEDQYSGHCETMAVFFSRTVMDSLRAAPAAAPAGVLPAAYAGARARLDSLATWEARVGVLFEAEARARADAAQAGARKGRTLAMWAPLLVGREGGSGGGGGGGGGAAAMGTVARSAAAFLAGSPGVGARLAEAVAAAAAGGLSCMPLYILNYIWDGDELCAADLVVDTIETAQYSCHVVGLVVDARARVAYVADPNGALVPGGNMEFLSLPFAPRKRPSTAVSQYDVDQAGTGKRGKK